MKIVHVISSLSKGGAERVAAELANEAVKSGKEVTIIAGWPENPLYLQNYLDPRISIKFISDSKKKAYKNFFFWICKNRKWLAGNDVIHCHLTFGAVFGSIAKLFTRGFARSKQPLIFETYHAVGMMIPERNRWLHAQMLKGRDGIILMARDSYWDDFISKNPKLNIRIIPNGISVSLPERSLASDAAFRADAGIPKVCKYIVGTVGMLRPDRKPWLYIPIFKQIDKELGDAVHFVIGGDGSEMPLIKSLIKENVLEHKVHLAGLVNNPVEMMINFDVYVSMSVGAAVGISMFEAAMCSIPVVGIQLSMNYEVTPTDWVWSDSESTQVANQIISLLTDVEKHQRISKMQNEYVNKNFSSVAMSNSYFAFYSSIIKLPN